MNTNSLSRSVGFNPRYGIGAPTHCGTITGFVSRAGRHKAGRSSKTVRGCRFKNRRLYRGLKPTLQRPSHPRSSRVFLAVACLALLLTHCGPAFAVDVRQTMWGFDGQVVV